MGQNTPQEYRAAFAEKFKIPPRAGPLGKKNIDAKMPVIGVISHFGGPSGQL